MSALRDEIRAILREELSAVLAEHACGSVQQVRVDCSDDLNAFAKDLVERMSEPGFAEQVRIGGIRFQLEHSVMPISQPQPVSAPLIPARITTSPQSAVPVMDKKLITETDLVNVVPGILRVPHDARLTPLAKDEARRKGVRIERTET